MTARGLTVGSGSAKNATYTYVAGGQGTNSTTGLVHKITQFGKTLTYAYDNVGNITSVGDGTKTVSYVYDKLGQLTRANDPYDTTAGSAGTTWVYAYDQGGNILSKTAYAYTTGTVGSAVKTDSYTYGDANWKDKLTAFNGTTISYDAIGNPTNDGTWSYTWEKGRQLKSMSKAGETAVFTYNADGLRVKKVCTTTGTTNYTLHGKNVVHLTNGSNNLHFFYDAQNRPAVVVFNGTAYGYVHNLQGDIIAIVNSAGTKVVEYAYDPWGKPLSKTGSLVSTLGTLNPFRYRGYVYDEETGLYYLRSRFYSSGVQRFINSDVLCGNNQYAYCNNSTVVFSDASGYACVCCFDENGFETSLTTQLAIGCGGVGSYAATSIAISGNKDTSKQYALYDNHRFNDDSVFHEQICVVTVTEPYLNLQSMKGSAGVEFDLMTGGWEWGNDTFGVDLSLFDVGHAELSGNISLAEGELKGVALASAWSPSVSITLFGIEISVGAEIGAVGGGIEAGFGWDGGISLKGAFGLGVSVGIDW